MKARRVAADAGIPCGVFVRDAYYKAERKAMEKTGKSPGELSYKPLPERRKGQTVYLKVFPSSAEHKIGVRFGRQKKKRIKKGYDRIGIKRTPESRLVHR